MLAMTTEQTRLTAEPAAAGNRPLLTLLFWYAALIVLVAFIAYHARTGLTSPRVLNPDVIGAPRPVRPLQGKDNWLDIFQTGTVVTMLICIIAWTWAWVRNPGRPVLLMLLAGTAIVWLDPVMNWAPYAVYNPELWHFPEDWPWVSVSPTVEPFIVIGYATFYVGPYFPAIWILRGVQGRSSKEAFVWRHPLLCLGALAFVIGFAMDAALEIFLIQAQAYIYSQVMPFGSIFTGTPFQFPLMVESTLVTLVMIPAAVLLYRDDTGRAQAEKLAQRLRLFRGRPALATFLVMFGILNLAYFAYGGGFLLIRANHLATSVACPWPYPEAKVFDPNGFYEQAGKPGPFFEGRWNSWIAGQPTGRPQVRPPAGGGRCTPARA
jgi:hypothetical protein